MELAKMQLKKRRQAIDYYLRNPEQIPEEWRASDQSPS